MELLYAAREEEGHIALAFRGYRSTANRSLGRVTRAQDAIARRAEVSPSRFAWRSEALIESLRPIEKRCAMARDVVLEQALRFEEGRRRLREMYDKIQKQRVIDDAPSPNRPLLQRLFNIQDD